MSPWLDDPLVQAAVVPFVVALISGLVLRRAGVPWAGLGFVLAGAAAVYLIAGFQILPLTSTRKILLAGAAAVLAGIALELMWRGRHTRLWFPAAAAAVLMLWVIWPAAARREGVEFWWMILPAMAYAGWHMVSFEGLNSRPVPALVAALMLASGTGISALLGASALMGQLGGAIAAALGAYIVLFLIQGEFTPGRALTIPATLLSALLGVSAVVYATLPWYSLVPLALIPLLARLPAGTGQSRSMKVILTSLYIMPGALAAVVITWRIAGAPPI